MIADFHVCFTCGAIPIVTCMIEGIRYAVFNVNTFDDVNRSQLVETANPNNQTILNFRFHAMAQPATGTA